MSNDKDDDVEIRVGGLVITGSEFSGGFKSINYSKARERIIVLSMSPEPEEKK